MDGSLATKFVMVASSITFFGALYYFAVNGVSSEVASSIVFWGSKVFFSWGFFSWGVTVFIQDLPYGKLAPVPGKDFGIMGSPGSIMGHPIPSNVAWCIQESPAFFVPVLCWATAPSALGMANKALLAMFIAHYFQRTFIYSLRINGSKGTPLSMVLSGFFLCAGSGLVQGVALTRHYTFSDDHLVSMQFLCGLAIWAIGMFINIQADSILLNLRKPGETGYKIPHGGMFEYVSGANFLGEILEWYGWALAGGHRTGLSFAVFTMFNVAPRACASHRWYLAKFDNYPKHRKGLIPFVY